MKKNEIIFELLKTLNQGNFGSYEYRVGIAEKQFDLLNSKGLLTGILDKEGSTNNGSKNLSEL